MNPNNDIRYQPLYGVSEAARYIHANHQVLRNWLTGSPFHHVSSVLEPATRNSVDKLSFVNLIEAHMLVALRTTHKVSIPKIRAATEWLKEETGNRHPLAECLIETDGMEIFVDHLGQLISASERGQVVIRGVMEQFLHRIERDKNGVPMSFYPFTRGVAAECPKDIVMSPEIAFGRPIVTGTRISTQMLAERFLAGDSLIALADDYDLKLTQVEEAVRCENLKAA